MKKILVRDVIDTERGRELVNLFEYGKRNWGKVRVNTCYGEETKNYVPRWKLWKSHCVKLLQQGLNEDFDLEMRKVNPMSYAQNYYDKTNAVWRVINTEYVRRI